MIPSQLKYIAKHAILHGDFTLASGEKSNIYVDMRRIICRSHGAAIIGRELANLISSTLSMTVPITIVGIAEAGIPVMQSIICSDTGTELNWMGGWIRKESKTHGLDGIWSGAPPCYNIVVVEDVITTGESVAKAICKLRNVHDCNIQLIACILNRKGVTSIEGVPVVSLCTLDELLLAGKVV